MTQVEPHHIVLADESVLVMDYNADEAEPFRVVYYSRKMRKGKGRPVSITKFDDLVRMRIMQPGYHTSWLRTAVTAKTLSFALHALAEHGKEPFNPAEVERYIRSTGWGRELP